MELPARGQRTARFMMASPRDPIYVVLLAGTVFAAVGQLALKLGATGRTHWMGFVNGWIALGLTCYLAGTLLWVFALSRASLTLVYPFTALTFVLVYAAGVLILGESTSARQLTGICLVLAGLYLVTSK